jgi:hypothetical protein
MTNAEFHSLCIWMTCLQPLTSHQSPPIIPHTKANLLLKYLHTLNLTIRLPGVNLLSRLLDSLQHGLVGKIRRSDNGRGLCIEGDVVRFDA